MGGGGGSVCDKTSTVLNTLQTCLSAGLSAVDDICILGLMAVVANQLLSCVHLSGKLKGLGRGGNGLNKF